MADAHCWFRFVLAVLATWRVTHLLASEDGPADLIARCRARLGQTFAGKLMDCFYCLSLWIAAPLAFAVCSAPLDRVLAWLAVSGGACLLNRLGTEPLMIQKGDWDHVLLRTEESGVDEHAARRR